MNLFERKYFLSTAGLVALLAAGGCTVKAVGDPNRPITINAHVTLDIKGLKDTATGIEDYVRGDASEKDILADKGGKNGT